jgi:hypothetical protein
MNKADRERVDEIIGTLEDLKAKIEEQGNALRELADAERDKFDNMPEGLQQGATGEAIDKAASALEEAADAADVGDVEDALTALGELE